MSSLGRHVKSTAACPATAAALEATVTPASLPAAVRAPALTSCTTSFTPALARFDAMGIPIVPRPMNPTVSFISWLLVLGKKDLGQEDRVQEDLAARRLRARAIISSSMRTKRRSAALHTWRSAPSTSNHAP